MPLPAGDNMAGLPQNQILLLFYFLCMPAFEEYFCRFLLVDFIKSKFNLSVAVLISTLGFAFAHYDFGALGSYVVFGLVFLVIRLKYQSLSLNIGLHWLANFFVAYHETVLGWYGRSVVGLKVLVFSQYYILLLLVTTLAIIFMIKFYRNETLPKFLIPLILIGSLVWPLHAYYSPESRMVVAALNNAQHMDNVVIYDAENQMADYEQKYVFEKLLKMLPDEKRFNILILSKRDKKATVNFSGNTIFINDLEREAPSALYFAYKSTFPYTYEDRIEGFAHLVDPLFLSLRKSYCDYYKSGGVDFTLLNNDDWYVAFLYDYLFHEGKLTSVEAFMEAAKENKDKRNQAMKAYFIELPEVEDSKNLED